ncbi:hypothetical protein [Natrinema caseinilyticum]|uniref:hypothetical protein n=1 Tax=Natrinema caseinilyticum TaxID=2961570 RepID=UPI0020C33FFE|nr:hypothetical protein [Natrinema caseinilyticum]
MSSGEYNGKIRGESLQRFAIVLSITGGIIYFEDPVGGPGPALIWAGVIVSLIGVGMVWFAGE